MVSGVIDPAKVTRQFRFNWPRSPVDAACVLLGLKLNPMRAQAELEFIANQLHQDLQDN
jgi:hypothetical protein